MRKTVITITIALVCMTGLHTATAQLAENTMADGLKQALSLSTDAAVKILGRTDGYFGNPMIKIPLPDKMQMVADALKKAGLEKQVDEFVLSMNRAAEKAAPKAASILVDAIKGMTIQDAKSILDGGDTAAADFFKNKTQENIYNAFKPIISNSMDETGTTKLFKNIMTKFPLMSTAQIDLDHHVTNKAIDGLFYMVGQQERMIRTDPGARTTDLLKKVFDK